MTEKFSRAEAIEKEELPGYKDPGLSIEERVSDLLSRMTLEEKVAQMLCVWGLKSTMLLDENGKFDYDNLHLHFKNGIGQIGRLSDTAGGLSAVEMAQVSNRIQKFFIEDTRLGIPVIFHEECLHGLAGKEATSFPQPIGLAATFNPELIERIYSAIAENTRHRGAHQALTPVVDVAREPRWGRVEETFGEDPYLVSRMGIAAVKGFQGDSTFKDKKHVIATLKHFAAHGQPESGTNCAPVNVSERLLRDVFLYPFKEVIENANALSVMASYNEIDGIPSHANKWLLRDVLRKEWGFKGFVVSDYYAVTELNRRDEAISNFVAKDKADAARLAVEAGVNLETPDIDCYPYITGLVSEGKLDESLVDELVRDLLKYKFYIGLFDDPYVDPGLINSELTLQKERPLALKAALETITLLKNENNILPLDINEKKTIAVIGPNADRKLLGGYSGEPKCFVSVLAGIKEKAGKNINVLYSEGCRLTEGGSWNDDIVTFADPELNKQLIKDAVDTAEKSDIIILALGDNEQTSREAWNNNHMGDRGNLELFGMQNDLVKALAELGKPMIMALINGRPVSITNVEPDFSAIIECWYLGQETGYAVADVLFGNFNPGGKLPISVPRSSGHVPSYYNYKPAARRGYLAEDITPLYPFGFGLSYTTFKIDNIKIENTVIGKNESTKVHFEITNTGSSAGHEVVQMYIHDMVSSVTRPVKELKGFVKVMLEPGESKSLSIDIYPGVLAFTDVNKNYVVEPGEFEILIGTSSRNEDLTKLLLTVVE
jgi:beta-glucosidase